MSDATHLTNYSGDKKAWPIYMTIENIDRETRARPTSFACVLLALLPVPHKLRELNTRGRKLQSDRNRMINSEVLKVILEPIRDASRPGMDVRCADNAVRRCFPRLATWIADYPEQCTIHGIFKNQCMWCECPSGQLGELGEPFPERNHRLYSQMWLKNDFGGLKALGVQPTENVLWWMPDVRVHLLAVPDLLHTIYIGMADHMLNWVTGFLKKHGRIDLFDQIWKNLPAYDTLTRPTKAYSEVSQWQGKEMRRFLKYLLVVFTAALRRPSDAGRQTFNNAIKCVRAFSEFVCYTQYDSHSGETLEYMEDALRQFHDAKEVFKPFRKS